MPDRESPLTTASSQEVRILEAAAEVFARDGFHGASMQDLAKAAGMSPGSIYRYFPSKEAIIEAIVDWDRAETVRVIQEAQREPDLPSALSRLFDLALAELSDEIAWALTAEVGAEAVRNPDVASMVVRYDAQVTGSLTEALTFAQEQGIIRSNIDPAATSVIIFALLEGLLLRRGREPDRDFGPVAREAKRAMFRMLGLERAPA